MKLSIDKSTLLAALDRCLPVVATRSPQAVLSCVLIKTEGNLLSISASNLREEITCSVTAKVKDAGLVAVDGKALANRVSAMPDGQVDLTLDGHSLFIGRKGKARRFTLHTLPGDDFPKLREPEGEAVEVPGKLLVQLIAGTKFSICPEEGRVQLHAALLEFSGNTTAMTTTDGHRLSRVVADRAGPSCSMNLLLPASAIVPLMKLAEDAETVGVARFSDGIGKNKTDRAFFTADGCALATLLPSATFPPYEQVIPKSFDHSFTANREELRSSLKAISSSTSETGGMLFVLENGQLLIKTESPDKGDGQDTIDVEGASDSVLHIGLRWQYLDNALGALSSELVRIQASRDIDPIRVCAEPPPESGDLVYIVMPMRI